MDKRHTRTMPRLKMKKFEQGPISAATYDMNNPFDVAQKLIDETRHLGESHNFVHNLLSWEMPHNAYTPFGKEIVKAFETIQGYVATNKGIGQKNVDFYKRYLTWLLENGMDMEIAVQRFTKMKENNPDLDFGVKNEIVLHK